MNFPGPLTHQPYHFINQGYNNFMFIHLKVKDILASTCTARLSLTFLSSRIYAISRQEIEQLGSFFDSTFILFPMKIGEGQAHSSGGKSPFLALNDSPGWSLDYFT